MSRRVRYAGSDLMIPGFAPPPAGGGGRPRMVGERRERSPRPNRVVVLVDQRGQRPEGGAELVSERHIAVRKEPPCPVPLDEALADQWIDAWLSALRADGASDATLRRRAEALAQAVTVGAQDVETRRARQAFTRWLAAKPPTESAGI